MPMQLLTNSQFLYGARAKSHICLRGGSLVTPMASSDCGLWCHIAGDRSARNGEEAGHFLLNYGTQMRIGNCNWEA
jgi:hypothetical protein